MPEKFGGMPRTVEASRMPDLEQRLREITLRLEDAEYNRREMEKARDSYSLVIEAVRGWFPNLVENDYLVDPKIEAAREFLNDLASRADFMEELRGECEAEAKALAEEKRKLSQN